MLKVSQNGLKLNTCSESRNAAPAGRLFHIKAKLPIAVIVAILMLGFVPRCSAQVSGSISGVVTDPAGLAVTGAMVSVDNLDTGLTREATTGAEGRYVFPALRVGTFEITVSKTGFEKEVRTGVHLVVGQEAVVDFALHVGSITEQVTVNADAPAVGLTTQDISGLVGEEQIKELPLNQRSFDLLTVLNPGVVNFTFEKTGGTGVSNSTNANGFSVEGNRPQQNIYLLNGVEFTGAAENNMQPGE